MRYNLYFCRRLNYKYIMTYREIVYACIDELKLSSDDTIITEDHIIFLLGKFRNLLLKQKYNDIKKPISESNYQTICLDLEEVSTTDSECANSYLRSIEKIPNTLPMGAVAVYPVDFFDTRITFITRNRMKYVGYNKWLKNIIYCSIAPNKHLYFTSSNPQYSYLEKVTMTAVFENIEEASKLGCTKEDNTSCDILDNDFPLEDALVPLLIEMVLKQLKPAEYSPSDEENDAQDNLDEVANGNNRRVQD